MKKPPTTNLNGTPVQPQWIEGLEPRAYFAADLSAAISFSSPASLAVKPGKPFAVSVVVSNIGDAAATGKLTTVLSVSASADGSSPIPEATVIKNIHLAAGAHATFRFNAKVPVGFTPGNYFAVADVDPGNTFGETNLANNVAVSANSLTVLSPFPQVDGTYEGTVVIKKGLDKGTVGTQTVVDSNENNSTGTVSVAGTDFFPNGVTISFVGTGTFQPNGSFTAVLTDVPADDAGTIRDVGKFKGNKSTGTYVNALNSGTFDDTFEG